MIGIYKITNQVNNKCYIGQSICIEKRWKEHIYEAEKGDKNYKLYLAIRKYGIDNFTFEVIEECSEKDLNEKEIFYIKKYDSYLNGYNSTLGGQGKNFQRIIEPQKIYELWDKGLSVKEINEILKDKIGHTTIQKYLQNYKNYSIKESNKRGFLRSQKNNQKKNPVKQYDLWGNFIAEYESYEQAEKITKIDSVLIGRVVNGRQKQAGGYQWLSLDQPPKDLTKSISLKFGVIQYDLNGKEIKRYISIAIAAKEMGCDSENITRVCKHQKGRKTACGYKWEYDYSIWDGVHI